MKIYAYNEMYLSNAMTNLAVMLDYAVNYKKQNIDEFVTKFIESGIALQFERGNPSIIAGKSGIELCEMVMSNSTSVVVTYQTLERSPEFWIGWVLAYYQWYSSRTFNEITIVVPLSELLSWYNTMHEADLMHFVEAMDVCMKKRPTNIEIYRKKIGLSQSELSSLSGVPIRSIQVYEQRIVDITKAQFRTLNALSNVLGCSIYDLLDSNVSIIKQK